MKDDTPLRGIHRHAMHMLPCCGYAVTAAADIDETEIRPPEPGDPTLCMNCGAVLAFGPDGKPGWPGLGVIEAFRLLDPAEYQRMMDARQKVIARGPYATDRDPHA